MKRLACLLVCVLLAGCEYGVPSPFPHRLRPVHVIIRDDVPDECWVQVRQAIEFWRSRCGVNYLRFDRSGVGGRVVVTWGDTGEGPNVYAETNGFEWFPRRRTVTLSSCMLRTTVHEFGHVLGLHHALPGDVDVDNIMLQTIDARRDTSMADWTVTDEQCEIVQ